MLLFEFEHPEEADRVLEIGRRNFQGNVLWLERWNPKVGCVQREDLVRESWVRIVGLPLQLWSREVFWKIGDGCGDFVAIDTNTEQRLELRWARILVRMRNQNCPKTIHLLEGMKSYARCNCGGSVRSGSLN